MSTPRADFLLELGFEELPTSYIRPALEQLASELREDIAEMRLASGDVATFATPRRLAVLVTDLVTRQEDYEEEASGPPAAAAWDKEGAPTKALLGFVAGKGASLDDVRRVKTPKGAGSNWSDLGMNLAPFHDSQPPNQTRCTQTNVMLPQ